MSRKPSTRKAQSPKKPARPTPRWRLRLSDVVFGSVMLAAGVFLMVALLTHNVLDPSWNVASDGEIGNWMGRPGATVSDALLQALGWASGGPAIALVIWGGILIWRTPQPRTGSVALFRWIFAGLGTTGFAAAVASLPVPQAWPLAPGLGGVIGDATLSTLAALPARFDLPAPVALAAGFALLLSIAGIFFTFGLRARDLTGDVPKRDVDARERLHRHALLPVVAHHVVDVVPDHVAVQRVAAQHHGLDDLLHNRLVGPRDGAGAETFAPAGDALIRLHLDQMGGALVVILLRIAQPFRHVVLQDVAGDAGDFHGKASPEICAGTEFGKSTGGRAGRPPVDHAIYFTMPSWRR